MSEFDLQQIWNSDAEQARQHYQSIADVEKLARRQSKDILYKIHRNVFSELIFSIVLYVLLAIGFYHWDAWAFWLLMAFIPPVFYLSYKAYWKYRKGLKSAHGQPVTDALRQYVHLTGAYIRRMKVLIYYLTPAGYALGLLAAVLANRQGKALNDLLLQFGLGAVVGLPLLAFLIWFSNKKYIQWVYGRHHDSLKDTLQNLAAQEYEKSAD